MRKAGFQSRCFQLLSWFGWCQKFEREAFIAVMQDMTLPHNITATTSMAEAIAGASYAVHALPVQHSRVFLHAIKVDKAASCWEIPVVL